MYEHVNIAADYIWILMHEWTLSYHCRPNGTAAWNVNPTEGAPVSTNVVKVNKYMEVSIHGWIPNDKLKLCCYSTVSCMVAGRIETLNLLVSEWPHFSRPCRVFSLRRCSRPSLTGSSRIFVCTRIDHMWSLTTLLALFLSSECGVVALSLLCLSCSPP